MLEFAIIMLLKRKAELNPKVKVCANEAPKRRGSLKDAKLHARIDAFALTSFFTCYLLFNMVYWNSYLNDY